MNCPLSDNLLAYASMSLRKSYPGRTRRYPRRTQSSKCSSASMPSPSNFLRWRSSSSRTCRRLRRRDSSWTCPNLDMFNVRSIEEIVAKLEDSKMVDDDNALPDAWVCPLFLARTFCTSSITMYWTTCFHIMPLYFHSSFFNVNIWVMSSWISIHCIVEEGNSTLGSPLVNQLERIA